MKTILGIDTSHNELSVALSLDKGRIIQEMSSCGNRLHSSNLIPLIEKLLNNNDIKLSDIDCFAVTTGPGSFTGLRIGISTVKGFAYSLNKQCIGLSTLDVLAFGVGDASNVDIVPIIDARNENVFFKKEKKYGFDNIEKVISNLKKDSIFVGDAVLKYKDMLLSKGFFNFAEPEKNYVKAGKLATLAYIRQDLLQDSFDLKPFYLKKSQPEELKK